MADLRKHSSTSNVVRFKLTKSADGTAFTGLTSSSSGLIISTISDNEATATAYTQAGSTIETISTLGTFAAPTSTKCRFKEVDATNHAGLYEFQFADARYSVASAKRLVISVSGVSGLFSADYEIQLTQADVYDAVRMGLTALPNAAADAAGGLPISDAGGLDLDSKLANTNEVTAARMGALTDWIDGGRLDLIIDLILADTNELQTNQGNWLTATGFSTHSAADVLTALGTGSWATSLATQASVDVIDGNVDLILADTGTDGVVVAAGSKSGYALSSAGVRAIWTDDWTALAFAADTAGGYVQMMATEIDGVVTKVAAIQDRVSYCLTVLVGACADAGTSAETYVHSIGGETFTVDYTGLDATGNRTTTTLSKV